MKYLYSAIFTPIEDGSGYYARVPDLPGCITTGSSLEDAIEQITDAMNVWLVTAEEDPCQSRRLLLRILDRELGAVYSLVQADTIAYRARTDTRAVRKNVSLPAWMANLADQR